MSLVLRTPFESGVGGGYQLVGYDNGLHTDDMVRITPS